MSSRPGRHSRSRSPNERRSRSPEHHKSDLPNGAEPISESDYFLKSSEFRIWLKDEKDRYFDELSGEKARSYFRKFVKAWNRGKVAKTLYEGVDTSKLPAASQTAYKWSFASKRPRAEQDAIQEARHAVHAATVGMNVASRSESSKEVRGSGKVQGPTLPSHQDLVMSREAAADLQFAERDYKRKRERTEDKERIDDLVGPKETGREGMLEKKRLKRDSDKSFKDAKDDVFGEYDDRTLMGGGDSFQARIAQRDAAKKRFEEKRAASRGDKDPSVRERATVLREKDKATMDMFKQMAKERFG